MAKVIVERRGAVLELRLNRPELLNAVDREAIAALGAAAAEAAEDRAVRVVLFSGEGTHFCAGGDITMFGELVRLPPEERRKVIYATVDALHPLLVRLRHMPKPVSRWSRAVRPGWGSVLCLPPIWRSPRRMRFLPAAMSISAPAPMAR